MALPASSDYGRNQVTHLTRTDEVVPIKFPEAERAKAQPEDIPLDIIVEDKCRLVLNKTARLVVHPQTHLHTSRTHQIRVHFQHLGFPVASDTTHGQRQTTRLAELTKYEAPRVLLHAHKLAFVHPRSGKKLNFTAPWPGDFEDALKFLRGSISNMA